jgi:hypothetical protein
LVGYAMLARAARRASHQLPKLDTFALYFSRHGRMWQLPASSVVDAPAFDAVENWFLASAKAASTRGPLPPPPPRASEPVWVDHDESADDWEEGLEDQSLYEWPYGADM